MSELAIWAEPNYNHLPSEAQTRAFCATVGRYIRVQERVIFRMRATSVLWNGRRVCASYCRPM
jgi:hypothetical protein